LRFWDLTVGKEMATMPQYTYRDPVSPNYGHTFFWHTFFSADSSLLFRLREHGNHGLNVVLVYSVATGRTLSRMDVPEGWTSIAAVCSANGRTMISANRKFPDLDFGGGTGPRRPGVDLRPSSETVTTAVVHRGFALPSVCCTAIVDRDPVPAGLFTVWETAS